MKAWQIFWSASLLVAGAAFAFITLVIAVKGFQDLRNLFQRWREHKEED
jgi:hypothetical protein